MFHSSVYWPTLSYVLPPYLPSAVECSTPFDINTSCFVLMSFLLLNAQLQGVGLSNHVPMQPAVTGRILFFDFDAVSEFFNGSHGRTIDSRFTGRDCVGNCGSGRTKSGSECLHLCTEETI